MLRRQFLQTAAAASASPAQNASTPGIKLGFDTYSIRAFEWKAIQFLDYAAGLKLDTVQISSLNDYESFDDTYLQKVKDHAARVGVTIDGGMGCICPSSTSWNKKDGEASTATASQNVLKGLKVAKAVGATSMRCFMGTRNDRHTSIPIEGHIENTVKVLKQVRSQCVDMGMKIAVENHAGDMQAREVLSLIEEAGKDFVGSCLDTGNPMWVAEDPMLTLEVLGPHVVTTHIRDSAVFEHPRGAAAQWVALGDGSVDFKKFVAAYRKICPNASMQLEIITGRPPEVLNYLEPEWWKAFPNTRAADFARFVALAKRGKPFMGAMVIGGSGKQPPAIEAALKEQQRIDLERSFDYAKKVLGVGVRWKS